MCEASDEDMLVDELGLEYRPALFEKKCCSSRWCSGEEGFGDFGGEGFRT